MTDLFKVPDGAVIAAAECTADFDEICKRLGADPEVRYIVYPRRLRMPKLRYRCIGIKLATARLATLMKTDFDNFFEIWLQRKGYGHYLSDIEEVRQFMGVAEGAINRLDNGLKWL